MGEKKSKKQTAGNVLVAMIFGVLIGIGMAVASIEYGGLDVKESGVLPWLTAWIVGLLLGIMLQIVVHEGGHLVFGLMTGYKFSSFRIANIIIVKSEGGIKIKRLSMKGTGGQCIMEPPPMVEGKYPYALYNIGGCLMNIALSAAMLAVWYYSTNGWITTVAILIAFVGVAGALLNGVPLVLGGLPNDGKNALSLGRNKAALRSFWVQLKVVSDQAKGVRLRDMDAAMFVQPTEAEMKDYMAASLCMMTLSWLIDKRCFAEAREEIERIDKSANLITLHRQMLNCERIMLELIGECRKEEVEKYLDEDYKTVIKMLPNYPSVIRTQYAVAVLYEGNEEEANKLRARFEKCAKSFPYETEITGERELMAIVDEKASTMIEG